MVELGMYQHFKGGLYEVIAIARHSEGLEDMVVYINKTDDQVWVRPLSMWKETIEREGTKFIRFKKV